MSHPPRRRVLSAAAGLSALALTISGFGLGSQSSAATVLPEPTGRECVQSAGIGAVAEARQRAFAAASKTYGVPTSVLLGVSYMQSRWDDHGPAPSTSGGFGPMHLTDVDVEAAGLAKGEGAFGTSDGPDSLHTASIAAGLTQLEVSRLKSDDASNICAGAALLSRYQRDLGHVTGAGSSTPSWYDAVKTYSGSSTSAAATVFANRVFATIKSGVVRTTNDGQKVRLASERTLAVPSAKPVTAAAQADASSPHRLPTDVGV